MALRLYGTMFQSKSLFKGAQYNYWLSLSLPPLSLSLSLSGLASC